MNGAKNEALTAVYTALADRSVKVLEDLAHESVDFWKGAAALAILIDNLIGDGKEMSKNHPPEVTAAVISSLIIVMSVRLSEHPIVEKAAEAVMHDGIRIAAERNIELGDLA